MFERVPPSNKDAEQAVLAACLISQDALATAMTLLHPDDFYSAANRRIYNAILAVDGAGDPVDPLSVADWLKKSGELEAVGGAYYITGLSESLPSAGNTEYYCRQVLDAWRSREIIGATAKAHERAYADSDGALSDLLALGERVERKQGTLLPVSAHVRGLQERLARWADGEDHGILTGYDLIDRKLKGFRPGEFILLAARPSHGKSALAMNIAQNMAEDGHAIGVVSLEMSGDALTERILSRKYAIKFSEIERTQEEVGRVINKISRLDLPIFIEDDVESRWSPVNGAMRSLIRKGCRGIIVDYLQLMDADGRSDNRNQEIGLISRRMKNFAKRMGVWVLALAQLNREAEGKVPGNNHLRDSGSLEQDADKIIMIYRPEKAGIKTMPDSDLPSEGLALVLITKHRTGPTGGGLMTWREDYTAFENYIETGGDYAF